MPPERGFGVGLALPIMELNPRPAVPAGPSPVAIATARKPAWLKVKAPGGPTYGQVKAMMRELGLHTVCEEARCPNIGECWEHKAATFMILGDVCTRNCTYCAVAHGTPKRLRPRGAGPPGRGGGADGARARGHHLGRPGRPPQRRRRGVRRLHHRDPGPAARDLGRGADPRLQGLGSGARGS